MVILLKDIYSKLVRVNVNNKNLGHIFLGCVLTFILMYSYINFFYHIEKNWDKQDLKSAVKLYLDDDEDARVVVHGTARPVFAFYMTHYGKKTVIELNKDKYIPCNWNEYINIKEYLDEKRINEDVVYLFGSSIDYNNGINNEYIKYFNEKGYSEEVNKYYEAWSTKFTKIK